jgi:hypothetical protein
MKLQPGQKIEVTVMNHGGKVVVEAFGFDPAEVIEGLPACEAATKELEDRLGSVAQRERKYELAATQCGITTNLCG